MAVTAIKARCRRCRQDFHLFEMLDQRDGTCPRCGWSLSHHWTATLLEEAARADIAQRHLVDALRRLRNLPGNVLLRPHIVLRNLFEEVGWHKDLAEDTDTLQEELPELRQLLAAWELLDPDVAAALPAAVGFGESSTGSGDTRPSRCWRARPPLDIGARTTTTRNGTRAVTSECHPTRRCRPRPGPSASNRRSHASDRRSPGGEPPPPQD